MMSGGRNSRFTVRRMVRMALLGAIGVMLMVFIAFPIPPFPDFLTYDPGDVPAIIACFAMGPWYGVLVQAIKVLVAFVVGAIKAGPIGALANFLAGASYAIPAGYIYRKNRTKQGAVIAMAVGSIVTAVTMSLCNYFILLPFWGIPTEQIGGLIVSAIFPFNLVKTLISSVITFFLYKRVKNFFEEA